MKKPTRHIMTAASAAMAAVTIAASASAGTTIQIHPARTAAVPAGWNNCVFATNAPALYENLKDSTGTATDVSLFVMAPAPNSNWGWSASSTFTGDAAEFEEARKVSSGSITAYSTDPDLDSASTDACIRARVMGLDPDKLYEFRFIGSSMSTSVAEDVDLSTRYTVAGANAGSAVLNANRNTNQIARVSDIAPLPDGSVEFTVAGTESNTDDRRRGFLSAMKIAETASDIYIDPCGKPGSDSKTWNYNGETAWAKTISNLKDESGRATDVTIDQTCPSGTPTYHTKATLTFTGDADPFEAARSGDNQAFFWSGATPFITVSGLDPDATYSFSFVASREDSSTSANYSADYSVTGSNSGTATLDARSNTSQIATVSGISPTAAGVATIAITKNSANNKGVFCLCAYRIRKENASDTRAVAVLATPGGSVSATVGGAASANSRLLTSEKSLVATATPAAGYRFLCWTSPNSATAQTANPLTIPGTASATWTAVFVKSSSYTPRTVYVDAYGTPDSDSKSWNSLDDTAFERGGEQGPFMAVNGRTAYATLRTVHPAAKNLYNANATTAFTGEAADFEAARKGGTNGGRSLYFSYNFVSPKSAFFAYDLTGLKPGRPYTLRFVGTQMNATSDDRVVRYRCEGANVVQDSINTSLNTTDVATCANVVPDADGTIHIDISPDPANTSKNLFGYLTAFSFEGHLGKVDNSALTIVVK